MSFLIAGLGNPGTRYEKTRHNAGFLFIDRLALDYGIQLKRKIFDSLSVGSGMVCGERVVLVKPETFMNLSGKVFPKLFRVNGIDAQRCLVIVDNMDLPFGALRLKKGGSSAGHNGLKSVISAIGTSFYRLYIGVGRPEASERDTISHVLAPLTEEEMSILSETAVKIAEPLKNLFAGNFEKACHEINTLGKSGKTSS